MERGGPRVDAVEMELLVSFDQWEFVEKNMAF